MRQGNGAKNSACKPIWGKKVARANHFGAMTPRMQTKGVNAYIHIIIIC